ncbi:BRCT domain-containing protein, partial [Streptosporangium sp. NPDC001682]
QVLPQLSKMTSLLVAGENAGSKRAKAESLDVRIVGPEEFADLVGALL